MARLVMNLLGSPQLEHDDNPISVDTRKATALLVYLTITGESHTRDSLATLFWPEIDQSGARAALRRTLSSLKKALDGDFLAISRESLAFESNDDVWVDVCQFDSNLKEFQSHLHGRGLLCTRCRSLLQEAINLYRGDFLEGFPYIGSDAFEEWLNLKREEFKQQTIEILKIITEHHGGRVGADSSWRNSA